MGMRDQCGGSDTSGEKSCASDDLNRDVMESLAKRLLQPVKIVAPVREDALPVVEIHQASGEPMAGDTTLKQG